MTKIGEEYMGIWPKHPTKAQEGDVVRYPLPRGGKIARARIEMIVRDIAYLSNGDWCYVRQLSEDKD
jgi:hypothetical protein